MHAMKLTAPGGLDQLHLAEIEPRAPGFGEIQVEIKATSLNFHDYAVVTGLIPADDGRIPMSDGAGVVTRSGGGHDFCGGGAGTQLLLSQLGRRQADVTQSARRAGRPH